MSYPEIKIHLIVQIAVKPLLVCLLSPLSVCDSPRESYDGTPGSKIRQIGFLFQRMAVFILEDALSVQTDNASLVVCV